MAANEKETFRSAVSDRLTDFFGEPKPSKPSANDPNASGPQDSPLTNLKAILLSIEWEITDEILTELTFEIERLKDVCQDDKILFSFLQLNGSIAKYIKTRKVAAHPDAIKLLYSVYQGLENVWVSPQTSPAEKKRLLADEIEKFKVLKAQILTAQKDALRPAETGLAQASRPADQHGEAGPQASETKIISQDNNFVLEEIKKTIKAEFEILKEELRAFVKDLHRR